MIGRRRPKEEHPELFLPLVTHADVRATCGLRGVGILDVKLLNVAFSFDATLFLRVK